VKLIVSVYRSKRKEGMYLYVEQNKGLETLSEPLLKQFGVAEHAMVLVLTPEKKLANADVEKVIQAVQNEGFYLQMPPRVDQIMSEIAEKNSKMPR
jgi:uncharacterized protein YcgL (UPF0745 family)